MIEYHCKKDDEEKVIMRIDVIGEPNLFQQIILFCGGTIKLKGWKIKRRKV